MVQYNLFREGKEEDELVGDEELAARLMEEREEWPGAEEDEPREGESRQEFLLGKWRERVGTQVEEEWKKEHPVEAEEREGGTREEEYLRRVQEEAAEKGWPIPETYEEALELKKREKRVFELGREVEEAGRKRKLTEYERERTLLKKAKEELAEKRERRVGRWAKRAALLGGVPAVERKGGIRDMYFGRAKPSLYVPPAPKEVIPKETVKKLREVTTLGAPRAGVDTSYARRLVQPGGKELRQPLHFGFLRELLMPKGLSPVEQYAFAEIRENNDRDTVRHVVSQLAQLGISRKQAENAVRSLLQKGYVRKVRDFKDKEPILEIARR